jgi:hypothetical protein
MVTEKLKGHKSPSTVGITAELISAGHGAVIALFVTILMKHSVVIIAECRRYQLQSSIHLIFEFNSTRRRRCG